MKQDIKETFREDELGKPFGGETEALGLRISWQEGPLVNPYTGQRMEPNGCFVETVIRAAMGRLHYYQHVNHAIFNCDENDKAIALLQSALLWLNRRTIDRENRGVEGTHQT